MRCALLVLIGLLASTGAHSQGIQWESISDPLEAPWKPSATTMLSLESGARLYGTAAGLFRSEVGEPWVRVSADSLRDLYVHALTEGATGILASTARFGALRSTDDGMTWHEFGLPRLAVLGAAELDDGTFIAITREPLGPYASRDCVYTRSSSFNPWVLTGAFPLGVSVYLNGVFALPGVVLARSWPGLYASTDYGVTWEQVGPEPVRSLAVARDGTDAILLTNDAMWRSEDSGLTWSEMFDYQLDAGLAVLGLGSSFQKYLLQRLTGSSTLWSFDDSGSFTELVSVSGGQAMQKLSFPVDVNDPVLSSTASEGASELVLPFSSSELANEGFSRHFDAYHVAASGSALVLHTRRNTGQSGSIHTSEDNGSTWSEYSTPVGRPASFAAFANGNLLIGAEDEVYRSDNGGASWDSVAVDRSNPLYPGRISALHETRAGTLIVGANWTNRMGYFGDFRRSGDSATSWLPRPLAPPSMGTVLEIVEADNGAMFASHGGGIEGGQWGLTRSVDDGETWELVSDRDVSSLVALDGGDLLAVSSNSLYQVSSDGSAWTLIRELPSSYLNLFQFSDDRLFAFGSPYRGVVVSDDSGLTWIEMNAGIGNLNPQSMVQDADGHVVLGTASGLYRSVQPLPVRLSDEPRQTWSVSPVFPNPFRSQGALKISVPSASSALVRVYDSIGRLLSNEVRLLPGGTHDVVMDATGWTTGTYIVTVQLGDETQTRRMTVLK